METYFGFPTPTIAEPVFLTIGNFDGVHRGHQFLVGELAAAAHAAGGLAGLLTFDPHPLAVLRPGAHFLRLTSNEERASLLAALGLDFVLVLPFTLATANTSSAEFMSTLAERLALQALWIGPDFALGRGREGNAARLAELGQELGYTVRVIPPYELSTPNGRWRNEPVRSSRIRALLAQEGAVEAAANLLGRPYQVWGQVAEGAKRGRRLGFPTANLALPADRVTPAHGVYACWAWRADCGYPAVVNVGVRPSFDNGLPSVEAYLLDFADNLYGETLGLSFIRRLRDEMRFADISALIAQINADAEAARAILADPPDDARQGDPAVVAPAAPARRGDPAVVAPVASEPGAGTEARPYWVELPHTADWAIRVIGSSLRQLFARTAAAMYALQDADPGQPITLARSIEAAAADTPELLVAWLNRLLLAQELDGEMYTRFEIHEISDRGLRGVAYGYRGTPSHTGIKAVTYHDLDVSETAEGWQAQVTFDV